jgi:ribosomal protein S18 acetylase RimI-like enzyme
MIAPPLKAGGIVLSALKCPEAAQAGRDFHLTMIAAHSTGMPAELAQIAWRFRINDLLRHIRDHDSRAIVAWGHGGPIGLCVVDALESREVDEQLASPGVREVVMQHLRGRLAHVRCCGVVPFWEGRGVERSMLEHVVARMRTEATGGSAFTTIAGVTASPSMDALPILYNQLGFEYKTEFADRRWLVALSLL